MPNATISARLLGAATALSLLTCAAAAQRGTRASGEIEAYPASVEVCSGHATGAPQAPGMPMAHVAVWTVYYSTDPLEKVVAHYLKTLGTKNHVRRAAEHRWRFRLEKAERLLSLAPPPGVFPWAGCKALPGEARTVIVISTTARR